MLLGFRFATLFGIRFKSFWFLFYVLFRFRFPPALFGLRSFSPFVSRPFGTCCSSLRLSLRARSFQYSVQVISSFVSRPLQPSCRGRSFRHSSCVLSFLLSTFVSGPSLASSSLSFRACLFQHSVRVLFGYRFSSFPFSSPLSFQVLLSLLFALVSFSIRFAYFSVFVLRAFRYSFRPISTFASRLGSWLSLSLKSQNCLWEGDGHLRCIPYARRCAVCE